MCVCDSNEARQLARHQPCWTEGTGVGAGAGAGAATGVGAGAGAGAEVVWSSREWSPVGELVCEWMIGCVCVRFKRSSPTCKTPTAKLP